MLMCYLFKACYNMRLQTSCGYAFFCQPFELHERHVLHMKARCQGCKRIKVLAVQLPACLGCCINQCNHRTVVVFDGVWPVCGCKPDLPCEMTTEIGLAKHTGP